MKFWAASFQKSRLSKILTNHKAPTSSGGLPHSQNIARQSLATLPTHCRLKANHLANFRRLREGLKFTAYLANFCLESLTVCHVGGRNTPTQPLQRPNGFAWRNRGRAILDQLPRPGGEGSTPPARSAARARSCRR